ncbi:hypothetical protein PAPHI01_1782 [Pancytospora philotis]|nr:hypothetical protein PAPHI01_1782 [Pancytospora philotis]
MFRRAKLAEKLARENKFKEPKVRKCKEIVTHAKERNDVERIFALASFPKKRQALYRTVVGLPQTELDQNIYMLADIVLRCLLEDSVIDKLFYTALGRLLRSARGAAI